MIIPKTLKRVDYIPPNTLDFLKTLHILHAKLCSKTY